MATFWSGRPHLLTKHNTRALVKIVKKKISKFYLMN
jgi:hypothetical protein